MIKSKTQIRVRYSETDQMGVVYNGNYAQYFEIGRVELLRDLGISYLELEQTGITLPVLELYSKYIRPAKYDDLLTVQTEIRDWPESRITFHYEILNDRGTLLHIGHVILVFFDMEQKRPCRIPEKLAAIFSPYFNG